MIQFDEHIFQRGWFNHQQPPQPFLRASFFESVVVYKTCVCLGWIWLDFVGSMISIQNVRAGLSSHGLCLAVAGLCWGRIGFLQGTLLHDAPGIQKKPWGIRFRPADFDFGLFGLPGCPGYCRIAIQNYRRSTGPRS